jgi:hypothetical protein
MSRHPRDPRRRGRAADREVTRRLRALLAPPGGDAYWDGLEARVMARVRDAGGAEERLGWWSCFERWLRPGLVAAGLAVAAALLALARSRDADARVAYEAVLAQPQPEPAALVSATPARAREATFQYVLSH